MDGRVTPLPYPPTSFAKSLGVGILYALAVFASPLPLLIPFGMHWALMTLAMFVLTVSLTDLHARTARAGYLAGDVSAATYRRFLWITFILFMAPVTIWRLVAMGIGMAGYGR